MKEQLQKIFSKAGFQIKRYPDADPDMLRRFKILKHCKIDTLFDIGANIGQYGSSMRKFGYSQKLISFEPLKSAFQELQKASSKDDNWVINNYALGNENTKSVINVAGNSFSSSILNMLPTHLDHAPESKYTTQEEIEIKTLDTIFNSFCGKESRVMIKIDTQGFEKNVIDGATESLKVIKMIQMEMSIVPLYESEMTYIEMINYLDNKGFQLFGLENGFSDQITGQLLQVDGIFVNKNL